MQNIDQNKLYFFLYSFPLIALSRSFLINLYFIISSLIFLYLFYKNESKIEDNIKLIIKSFFLFYIYIIIISFFSHEPFSSLKSSFSQLRFFLYFLFCFYFCTFNFKIFKNLVLTFQIIIFFFSIDLIFQSFMGFNFFGLKPVLDNPNRFSGMFGDELVAGTFIYFLATPIIAHIVGQFKIYSNKLKIFNIIFIFVVTLAIIQTGDRMSTLLYFSSLIIVLFIILNSKMFLRLLFVILFFLILALSSFQNVNKRYSNLYDDLSNIKNFGYVRLFSSSLNIWLNNKVFGVGVKNYRNVCDISTIDKNTNLQTLCSTHPHNYALELFVETGLVGFFLFFVFIFFIFKYLYLKKTLFKKENVYSSYAIGLLITLCFFLWPIKSSGSMFTTFYMSFVWFNLSILFCCTKECNGK